MKCPYTTLCDKCGLQNSENCNICNLMNNLYDCPYVDTSGMRSTKECVDCENYQKGVRPTGSIKLYKLWNWLKITAGQ